MKRLAYAAALAALIAAWLGAPAHCAVVFSQPHDGSGTLHKSSWYPPDGLDGDVYCWDGFSLGSATAITEIRWRGGYELHPSGTGQSPVSDFEISIYRSIPAGTQPDLGAGGRLYHQFVGGNAAETSAGPFGGVAMFDYDYVLPSPFQAAATTPYWIQIEASQGAVAPSFAPDWGFAVGAGGNNSHFRFTTGGIYQTITQDLAFSLLASDGATVAIDATVSPPGAGSITGAGAYPVGSLVSLLASPAVGWGFVNWTENGAVVSSQPSYGFTATTNRSLVANFVPAYTITTQSSPPYAGVTTGDGVYNTGATVNLNAIPNHGFVFTGWSDGAVTALHSFPAEFDALLTAFFESAFDAVTYDFDNAPAHSSFPLDLTINGLGAHFTGNYSIQTCDALGFTPVGFSGLCVYPNSVFASDLVIDFSEMLKDFSVLYAVSELACNSSATMRVTAYRDGVFAGTNTMNATPGTYPTATLAIVAPSGFNRAVVHWDAPGSGCQDYGPIFLADIVTVTRLAPVSVPPDQPLPTSARFLAPEPNPFRRVTAFTFVLPASGPGTLAVYDVSGRLIRTLAKGTLDAGPHTIEWDALDDAGRDVGSGVYQIILEAGASRLMHRVVRIH